MKEYILHNHGKADHLKLETVDDEPKPGKGEVLIKHTAVGVNFFDIHFRRGDYKINHMPAVIGLEGCGIIEAIGPEVTEYQVGERVAYATGGIGAYTEKRIIDQHFLVTPPKNLTDVQVAGSLLKGMMAHTLIHRVYIASKAKRVLIHAAAGGVGQFLCNWAKHLGLEVIGTVGDDFKIPIAKAAGCDYVINYNKEDFLKKVDEITNGNGVGLVYDGVGKDTILKSIDCLWPMGMCISYGEASGPTPPINLNSLLLNSLYLTRPTLALYKANRIELVLSATEVFKKITEGVLRPNITTFNFSELPKVHQKLENRQSTGSLVLTFL